MINPHETLKSVSAQTRHARKSGARLLFSGVGFSLAYFLDPDQGRARRQQAMDYLSRARQVMASAKWVDENAALTKIDASARHVAAARTDFPSDGLRMAR